MQSLWNIAEICARHDITHAVLSPGSRCAPLVHGFTNHSDIECFTVTDERSAGFIALGIAQQTRKPVALICTSGTAGVNYFSAIAEAFYQDIPLLILTADRPPELLDQQDGQTIHQREIYGKHIRKSFQFPDDFLHSDKIWHSERIVNEAVNLCLDFPQKPVHINIPIREPFYPEKGTKIVFKQEIQFIKKEKTTSVLAPETIEYLQNKIQKSGKILIIAGQDYQDLELCEILSNLNIPILSDIISNTHSIPQRIKHQDFILLNSNFKSKIGNPDLILTFGKSILSKNVKLFLRKHKPHQHWHIQENGYVADTFQSLTKIIPISVLDFFKKVFSKKANLEIEKKRQDYFTIWEEIEKKFENLFPSFFKNYEFSEPEIIFETLRQIPNHTILHLANSMTVRYANVFNFIKHSKSINCIHVFGNRGTSGIDGSNSTAVGHALVSEELNLLITGDLAFFYDRNAWWNQNLPKNLRVILLNNQGGGIFNMIAGPRSISSSENYFLTPHKNNAQNLCKDFNIEYKLVIHKKDFTKKLHSFFEPSITPKLLECTTDIEINSDIWADLRQIVKEFTQ